ncbi:MAG: SDR family NAD(P)-dependent oxidoreductase [Bacteroidetes bacterium]|jgi:3-hydroxy acid dehydrogenase/malonic semialdehyde reductase|nr:SDR family NAD(P)-dependent oxidoreductase [Bacteroidota bacterium]
MEQKRTAIITGASSGIGEAAAIRFAQGGWNLILTARRMEKLESLKAKIDQKYQQKTWLFKQDVRHPDSGEKLAAWLHESQIKPDLLINNAGLAVGVSPIHQGVADDWERMIDTNIKGLLYVSRAISEIMTDQGFGHIINIGSIAGKEAYPGGNVYCATKHAIDGLTKAMRIDLLPYGIRVSQVAPGAVETAFSLVRYKGNQSQAKKVYDGFVPLNAADVADALWFVANVPAHVNINDLVIMPTAQASAGHIKRETTT